jgi:hypothetical protein
MGNRGVDERAAAAEYPTQCAAVFAAFGGSVLIWQQGLAIGHRTQDNPIVRACCRID